MNTPCVVLALCKPPTWNFGFLLITDFTKYPSPNYNKSKTMNNLYSSLRLGTLDNISKDLIFTITVAHHQVQEVWEKLKTFNPNISNYSYEDPERWDLTKEGIISIVNMRIKVFENTTEGFLAHLRECSRTRTKDFLFRRFMKECEFSSFMSRYVKYIDYNLYHTLEPCFPIDVFMKEPEKPSTLPPKRGPDTSLPMITQQPKTRKISAAQVAFRQLISQPEESTEEATQSSWAGNSQDLGFTPTQKPHRTLHLDPSQGMERWLTYMMNTIHFPDIVSIALNAIPDHTSFETTARILCIRPPPESIFLKPFKRTLKIAEFSLVLGADATAGNLVVEFHHESEITSFFGVEEIEELLDVIDGLTDELVALQSNEVTVRIQKRTACLDFGFKKAYWGCGSRLADLHQVRSQ